MVNIGKLVGKAKGLIDQNEEKIEDGLDKVADVIDKKTGGKHADKIDNAVGKLKDVIGEKDSGKQSGESA